MAALLFFATPARGQPADDPYLYLEDPADPRAVAFYREGNARTREALDAIEGRKPLLERIRALSRESVRLSQLTLGGARIFYLKQSAVHAVPVLCMREGLAGAERELVDPERFSQPGAPAALDWFSPSPDGRHVAYGVSRGGSEDSVLRVHAVDERRDLPLEIDRTRFNAALAWHPDSSAFYYTRLPEGNPPAKRFANARVYRHVLGRETARDEIVFAAGAQGALDVPEHVQPALHLPLESRHAYAIVREGHRREIAVHVAEQRDLAAGKPRWRRLVRFDDEVVQAIGWRDDLYLLSRRDAPHHRVLRVKAGAGSLAGARPVVPEGDVVLEEMALARDALYLRTMLGGVDRLERVPLGLLGPRRPQFVRIPFDHAITQLVAHPRQEGALLRMQGWIDAPVVARVDRHGDVASTPLQPRAAADYSGMDEVRLYAPGHDGVRIPVTLIYRKGTRLTGDNPTLLTAYGSYGASVRPGFDPVRLAWLERGGVYAIAHVRGGGEYGARWHQAGRGATKANTVLDFIAAADFLMGYGFTSPRRLATEATGAGAIPVLGAMMRRPELFAAVVARAPLADLVRAEHAADGPGSVPDFGSAATAAGRERLLALSPYHGVREGASYPAVLLSVGMNDVRVEPWHAAKLAARLRAAAPGGRPVLVRADFAAGHGVRPREQREEELADAWTFVLWQLGDPRFQPPPPPPPPPPLPAPPPAPAPPPPQPRPQPAPVEPAGG